MEHIYRTKGTCSREISFELDGDKVRNVHFVGGCDGNLKAVSKLVDGMSVAQIEALLRGNTCGPRSTSCADQLAMAVQQAYEQAEVTNMCTRRKAALAGRFYVYLTRPREAEYSAFISANSFSPSI